MAGTDTLDTRRTLSVEGSEYDDYSLAAAERNGLGSLDRLPFSLKVLLENMPRHAGMGDRSRDGNEAEYT